MRFEGLERFPVFGCWFWDCFLHVFDVSASFEGVECFLVFGFWFGVRFCKRLKVVGGLEWFLVFGFCKFLHVFYGFEGFERFLNVLFVFCFVLQVFFVF